MTGKKKGIKERAALDQMTDVFVDDILGASDEEILIEFAELHGDPDRNTADMRALFESSLLRSNKKRLVAAKAGAAESRSPSKPSANHPIDIQAARARLRAVINSPSLPPNITLAARKEQELSDLDILGMLEDLQELGILPSDDSHSD